MVQCFSKLCFQDKNQQTVSQELPRRSVCSTCTYTIDWLGISLRTFLLWQTVVSENTLVAYVATLSSCVGLNRLPDFYIGDPYYFLYYILNKRGLLNCKQLKYISFCTDKFLQVFQSWEMWYGPLSTLKTVAGFSH